MTLWSHGLVSPDFSSDDQSVFQQFIGEESPAEFDRRIPPHWSNI